MIIPVIGPPAAGKSTLVTALLASHGGRVFRMRDYARRQAEQDPGLAAAIEATVDELGWFSEEVAMRLLEEAVGQSAAAVSDSQMYLENYPGGACEADHLARMGRRGPAAVVEAVELVVPDAEVNLRSRRRRVCAVCEPDLHRPAEAHAGSANVCARCGSRLQGRAADSPSVFSARLARYRDRIDGIRRAFSASDVRLHRIPADGDPGACLDAACRSLARLLERSSE